MDIPAALATQLVVQSEPPSPRLSGRPVIYLVVLTFAPARMVRERPDAACEPDSKKPTEFKLPPASTVR